MYPDTDSAPISISQERIDNIKMNLPVDVDKRIAQLGSWNVPRDTYKYILRNNLIPLIERISNDFDVEPRFVSALLGHRLKHIEGHMKDYPFDYERIYELFAFAKDKDLKKEILCEMLPKVVRYPEMSISSIFESIAPNKQDIDSIYSLIPALHEKFGHIRTSKKPSAEHRWMMKELRKVAIGYIPLKDLASTIRKGGCK
jgi:glutamyl-tRNA(Gln) amidotransferase subunit E